MQEEVAIVREGEAGKTEATAGAEPIRPFHQHPLEVMLNERMLQHVPGSVGDQSCLRHRVFVRGVVRIGFFAELEDSLSSPACPATRNSSVKLFASNACRTFSIWLRAYGLISSSIESSGACSSRV